MRGWALDGGRKANSASQLAFAAAAGLQTEKGTRQKSDGHNREDGGKGRTRGVAKPESEILALNHGHVATPTSFEIMFSD